MKIKQFFYQPADGVPGNYSITTVGYWAIECESDNKNYKKSTMYKWLSDNCLGNWKLEGCMMDIQSDNLYIKMYDQADALFFSLTYNIPMPEAYELELDL